MELKGHQGDDQCEQNLELTPVADGGDEGCTYDAPENVDDLPVVATRIVLRPSELEAFHDGTGLAGQRVAHEANDFSISASDTAIPHEGT